jgi:hypothetical protein
MTLHGLEGTEHRQGDLQALGLWAKSNLPSYIDRQLCEINRQELVETEGGDLPCVQGSQDFTGNQRYFGCTFAHDQMIKGAHPPDLSSNAISLAKAAAPLP